MDARPSAQRSRMSASRSAPASRFRLTPRADAVKLHAVFPKLVPNHPLHATVQDLLIRNREVLQGAALNATDVIVPPPLCLVARRTVADLAFQQYSLLHQELQIAVNRPQTD